MKISSAMITTAALGMGLFILIGHGFSSESGMNDKDMTDSKMESSMEEPMAETMDMEPTSSSGEKGHDEDMDKEMKDGMDKAMKSDEMAKSEDSGMNGEKEGGMQMPPKDSEKIMNQ